MNVPPSPPFSHKVVVSTIAVFAGIYAFLRAGRDFQFIKYTPHLPEEVERRKKERIGLQMRHTDSRTLEYTPEAKERIRKGLEEMKVLEQGESPEK